MIRGLLATIAMVFMISLLAGCGGEEPATPAGATNNANQPAGQGQAPSRTPPAGGTSPTVDPDAAPGTGGN